MPRGREAGEAWTAVDRVMAGPLRIATGLLWPLNSHVDWLGVPPVQWSQTDPQHLFRIFPNEIQNLIVKMIVEYSVVHCKSKGVNVLYHGLCV